MHRRALASALAVALAACSTDPPAELTSPASAAAVVSVAASAVPATASAAPVASSGVVAAVAASVVAAASSSASAAPAPAVSAAPRFLPSNPGCAVPAGQDSWSWRRVHRVSGLPEPAVILTLDVGAKIPILEKVLDVLRDASVRTTIFLYTAEIEQSPRGREIVLRMTQDGHELANHTLTHADLTRLDEDGVRAELDGPERFVSQISGTASTRPFFREPFLATNDQVDAIVKQRCYRSIWFTVDTADWKEGATAAGIVKSVFEERGKPRTIESGSIFIFHGSQEANISALPQVIAGLRERGFAFLTLGEALRRAPRQ